MDYLKRVVSLSKRSNILCLELPESFRPSLSIPGGKLIVSDNEVIAGLRAYATVGDIVSQRHVSSLKIVDAKTRRSRTVEESVATGDIKAVVLNPRGCVSLNAFTALYSVRSGLVFVIGEEDLLVTPLMYLRPGSTILYGQPGVGVVETVGDVTRALKVLKILKPVLVEAGSEQVFDHG